MPRPARAYLNPWYSLVHNLGTPQEENETNLEPPQKKIVVVPRLWKGTYNSLVGDQVISKCGCFRESLALSIIGPLEVSEGFADCTAKIGASCLVNAQQPTHGFLNLEHDQSGSRDVGTATIFAIPPEGNNCPTFSLRVA